MGKDHDRGARRSPLQVGRNPRELLRTQGAKTAWFELQYIDEPDEVHAGMVKAVIPLVVGGLTKSIEVFRDRRIGGVVLAGYGVHLGGAQTSEQLLREIEFGGLRQMRDVARMD